MSPSHRKTPVIVGVGDVVNRSKSMEDAIEPLQLMIMAIQSAIKDTELPASAVAKLQSAIDSIDVVASWTWPCDYPRLIAERLQVAGKALHTHMSEHGGNEACHLLDEAARRISMGENTVAVVTGGEALASLTAFASAKKMPPPGWTTPNHEVTSVFSPTTRDLDPTYGARHNIGNPTQIYPLYENAFRARRTQSIPDNHSESAAMYAEFAKVAEKNEHAWNYPAPATTEHQIKTISKKNRIICFPYPLLMNAFNTVNLSAAVVLTSTEYARELAIPSDRWIYPLGGAGTADSSDFWKRPAYWWSPSISRSLDTALDVSSVKTSDIDLYDFYSCFPIVPKLACEHLGLQTTASPKPITLLGGLTSFGGAGNNYSMHAISEMVRQLRQGKGKTGLVLANGGWVTYQHAVVLSKSPRKDGLPYPDEAPLPNLVTDVQIPPIAEQAEGDAIVETYTVDYNRDGSPLRGHVVGRLKNGHRFLANHADEETLRKLCSWEVEPINQSGRVSVGPEGRNVFSFGELAKL